MPLPRLVAGRVIVAYWVVASALVALINLVLFPGPLFDPVSRATAGLANATLQANALNLALFAGIVLGWGRLQPRDVGLDRSRLREALLLTAGLWLAAQLIVALLAAANGNLQVDPAWSARGVTVVLGSLLAQLLGNALFEEAAYRGFYLGQLGARLAARPNLPPGGALVLAALVTQVLFVLSHVPNRIFAGLSLADIPADFAFLFVLGLFFTLVYRATGNLFLAVGVHALMNRPTLVTLAPLPAGYLVGLLAALLSIYLWRRRRSTGS